VGKFHDVLTLEIADRAAVAVSSHVALSAR
jgi:hypothetical protein